MHICHVALAWLWLGPLLNPAESLSSLIRGLHHAPVSLGKRWLSSWEPSGEERGRNCVLAGVELSAHKYTHEGAGWKSFKSCFVSLDEGGGCESLVWMCQSVRGRPSAQIPREKATSPRSDCFLCISKCVLCWNGSSPIVVPSSSIYTWGYQQQWGFNAWMWGSRDHKELDLWSWRGEVKSTSRRIQADSSVIVFPGLCAAMLLLQLRGMHRSLLAGGDAR